MSRHRPLISLAAAALLAVLAIGVVAPAIAGRPAAHGMRAISAEQLKGVNFVTVCGFSHRAPDDPIVAPNAPGASHDHTFVGNRTTSAFSTLRSLRRSATTCKRSQDRAAYWVPTLLSEGQPVEPQRATIYYRRATLAPVVAFPPGFRAVAGDAGATAPQAGRVTWWSCGGESGIQPTAEVPTCPDSGRNGLRLHVRFGSCWDGRLDSADHRSHLAYPRRAACPASHPIAVPAITAIFKYAIQGGAGITLSSGGQYSGHADFFNAWHQPALRSLVAGCLNALRHCAQGS